MKTVGRRKDRPSRLLDAKPLQRLLADLRGTERLIPRSGVHRFRSFEEAESWLIQTMARTSVLHSSRISSGSAAR